MTQEETKFHDVVTNLALGVGRIEGKLDTALRELSDHEKRVSALETDLKSAKRAASWLAGAVATVVSAAGYVISQWRSH
jgi:hypothetical protein